jgi:citrate lyase subunit beta/citryl-CoA lyase
MAARANGVAPIDTVHIHVHDLEGLERNLSVAKNLGFEGMLVLHPKEIPLAHRYFSPSPDEVRRAEEMLQLYEHSVLENKGVAVVDGRFVGPPMVALAKRVLRRAELLARKRT